MGVSVFLAGFRSLFCGLGRIFTGYLGHGEPLTQWISHDSMVSNYQEFFRVLAYIAGNNTGNGILRTLSHGMNPAGNEKPRLNKTGNVNISLQAERFSPAAGR